MRITKSRTRPLQHVMGLALSAGLIGCAPAGASLRDAAWTDATRRGDLREVPSSPGGDRVAAARALLTEPLDARRAATVALLLGAGVEEAGMMAELAAAELDGAWPANPTAYMTIVAQAPLGLEFGISQDLTSILALGHQRRAARQALAGAEALATARLLGHALEAKLAFYQAAQTASVAALRASRYEAAQAALALTQAGYRAGGATRAQVLADELWVEESRDLARTAQAAAAEARLGLSIAMGISGDLGGYQIQAALPAPDQPAPSRDELERTAVRRSLALEAAAAAIDGARAGVGLARVRSLPSVSVGVEASKDHGSTEGWHYGPTVGLGLPVFDRGQRRRRIAWAALRGAEVAERTQAIALRGHARQIAYAEAEAADRVRRLSQKVVPLYEQLMAESVLRYNAMEVSPAELLALRQRELDARVRLVEATAEYWRQRARRDHLIAGGDVSMSTMRMPAAGAGEMDAATAPAGHGGH